MTRVPSHRSRTAAHAWLRPRMPPRLKGIAPHPSPPMETFEWHECGERHGVLLRARFFDVCTASHPEGGDESPLCFLPGVAARRLWSEEDRRNLRWHGVVAQSDAVYALGQGLLNLEYKSRSQRPISRSEWLQQVRTKDMLQCLITAVVVAQNLDRPCAALLRYPNAGVLLVPRPWLMEKVFDLVPAALALYQERDVSASHLAKCLEVRLEKDFPQRDDAASRAGVEAHRRLFAGGH